MLEEWKQGFTNRKENEQYGHDERLPWWKNFHIILTVYCIEGKDVCVQKARSPSCSLRVQKVRK